MALSYERRDHSLTSSANAGDRRAAKQRDEIAPFQSVELHPAPKEPRPDRAARPTAFSPLYRARSTLLATCHRRTMAGTHTLLKPAFLARQLATSADIYLLASRCFLCESSFCRGSDQNNRGRQCTQRIERAHTVLLNQCRPLQAGDRSDFVQEKMAKAKKAPDVCPGLQVEELPRGRKPPLGLPTVSKSARRAIWGNPEGDGTIIRANPPLAAPPWPGLRKSAFQNRGRSAKSQTASASSTAKSTPSAVNCVARERASVISTELATVPLSTASSAQEPAHKR